MLFFVSVSLSRVNTRSLFSSCQSTRSLCCLFILLFSIWQHKYCLYEANIWMACFMIFTIRSDFDFRVPCRGLPKTVFRASLIISRHSEKHEPWLEPSFACRLFCESNWTIKWLLTRRFISLMFLFKHFLNDVRCSSSALLCPLCKHQQTKHDVCCIYCVFYIVKICFFLP